MNSKEAAALKEFEREELRKSITSESMRKKVVAQLNGK